METDWQKEVDRWRGEVDQRLCTLERDVTVILSNYVRKEDLNEAREALKDAIHQQMWRFIGVMAAYTAGIYFIASKVS